jgi:hypothetical protein
VDPIVTTATRLEAKDSVAVPESGDCQLVEGPQQVRFVELADPERAGVAAQAPRVAVCEPRLPGSNAHAGVAAAPLRKGAVVAANDGLVEARETTIDPADALDVYRSSIGT